MNSSDECDAGPKLCGEIANGLGIDPREGEGDSLSEIDG